MDEVHGRRITSVMNSLPPEVGVFMSTPSATLRYLTGLRLHKSERPLLAFFFRDEDPIFLAPTLEKDRLSTHCGSSLRIDTYDDSSNPVSAARSTFSRLYDHQMPDGLLAVEYDSTRLLECEVVEKYFQPSDLVNASKAISTKRMQKDNREISSLRNAAEITDRILSEVVESVEPGVTEAEIQREIRERVLLSDAESFGVDIVTSGPRTANPHANTSDRVIEEGDPLMIDTGVVYQGYYSDITRTFAVGDFSDEFATMYETVKDAARKAREAVKSGVECGTIDKKAREVIIDRGYGEYFPHRVGHGIGLESHEPPYLATNNDAPLRPGSVITVEPGIYIEGIGGVRIEDDLLVTETGAEVLTNAPRELAIL